MPVATPSKSVLRQELRQRRRALSATSRAAAAAAVATHIPELPGWQDARRIALYLANDGEVGTEAIAALCRGDNRELFLPVIDAELVLQFAHWQPDDPLPSNRYGIPEPGPTAARCPAAHLDIVVLPLVAWDTRGGRLGRGGGFYDRTLAGIGGIVRVGLGYAFQQVPGGIPKDEWDVPLDFVVTDEALFDCRAR